MSNYSQSGSAKSWVEFGAGARVWVRVCIWFHIWHEPTVTFRSWVELKVGFMLWVWLKIINLRLDNGNSGKFEFEFSRHDGGGWRHLRQPSTRFDPHQSSRLLLTFRTLWNRILHSERPQRLAEGSIYLLLCPDLRLANQYWSSNSNWGFRFKLTVKFRLHP